MWRRKTRQAGLTLGLPYGDRDSPDRGHKESLGILHLQIPMEACSLTGNSLTVGGNGCPHDPTDQVPVRPMALGLGHRQPSIFPPFFIHAGTARALTSSWKECFLSEGLVDVDLCVEVFKGLHATS
ncbi:MAG: hypothetical protein ABSB22_13560, partial [Thermodesulfobacteriota bacterium]